MAPIQEGSAHHGAPAVPAQESEFTSEELAAAQKLPEFIRPGFLKGIRAARAVKNRNTIVMDTILSHEGSVGHAA